MADRSTIMEEARHVYHSGKVVFELQRDRVDELAKEFFDRYNGQSPPTMQGLKENINGGYVKIYGMTVEVIDGS